jgi:hypothetical protein
MKPIKIDKNYLMDDLGLPFYADPGVIIEDEIIDTTRWSVVHNLIFKDGDTVYETTYRVGATYSPMKIITTEMQDEWPWEYEDMVECYEVEPVEVTKIEYKYVKGDK